MTQPTQISSFQIQDLWELSASSVPNASTEPSAVARLTPAAPDLPNFTFHEGTKEVLITRAPNHQIIVKRSPHNTSTEDIDSSDITGEPLARVFALDSDVSDKPTFMVEDVSKTGVFHNTRRLTPNQPTLLSHGDEISTKESVSDPPTSKPTGRVSYFFHSLSRYEENNFGTENSPLQEKYELLHTLGCGTSSTVKLAIDRKTMDRYACKIIHRRRAFADCVPRTVRTIRTENEYDSDEIQEVSKLESDQEGIHNSQNDDNGKSKAWEGVQREIEILKELSHTNITRFADFYEDAQAIYIIMELIPGGDLLTYISSSSVDMDGLPEFECREFFAQILDAVKYLHEKNIIHRDLKPENILLTANKKTLKITDFGLAIKLDDTRKGAETFCGTPMYAAPEIAQNGLIPGLSVESNEQTEKTPTPSTQNCPRTQLYGPGVDCWACGVTLYMMLTSRSPFESMFMQSMAERSTATYVPHLSPLLPPICTPEVVKLISELLTVDPKRRITAAAARDHFWFRQPRFWGRLTYRDTVDQKNPDGVGDVERKGRVRVEMWEKEVTVGRKSGRKIECKLYVDDPRASSRHCVLRSPATSNDDATIVDFSTNGCFVNGEKVKKGVPRSLKDGDELWFVMNPANQRDSVIYTFNVLSMHTLPPESSQEENEAEGEVVNPHGLEIPTRLNRKRSIEEIETEEVMSTKKRSKNEQQSSSDSMMAPQVPWGRLVSLVSSRPGVRLAGKKVRCGRLADCAPALRFNDARVSSHHCVFSRTAEGAVTVEDESINGTFVNGARLRKRVPRTLVSGDEIVMFYANQDREFASEKRGKGTTVGLDSSGKEVLIGYKLEC